MKEYFEEFKAWQIQIINDCIVEIGNKEWCGQYGLKEDYLELEKETVIAFNKFIDECIWKDLSQKYRDKLMTFMNNNKNSYEDLRPFEYRDVNFYFTLPSYFVLNFENTERTIKRFEKIQNKGE